MDKTEPRKNSGGSVQTLYVRCPYLEFGCTKPIELSLEVITEHISSHLGLSQPANGGVNPLISQPELLILELSHLLLQTHREIEIQKSRIKELEDAHNSNQEKILSLNSPLNNASPTEWEIDANEIKITKDIAQGAFGIVSSAVFRGTEVAVKKVLVQNLSDAEMKQFHSELNMIKKLHHPNIVLLIGVCSLPPNFVFITELLPGSMFDLLHDKNVMLDINLQKKLILDTALGMNYMHLFKPPILHRDLKPPNLLVDKNFNVKITDFGLARNKDYQMTGNLGTCQYMAPEVMQSHEYTEKADVFGFGITMWEVAVRKVPYQGMEAIRIALGVIQNNLRPQIPTSMPVWWINLMVACWDQDPSKRPPFSDIVECLKNN
eukprot:TRINITY_DN4987_c0_g1_i1.p1 TRINITY_DN4987_c0_g1~~TRINITY_DN4987_c0_g1_i1.p1  ORF type:complete len:377 (-),score=80.15 TRINITY_DN4987_c0_g1_i1:92-1222(-)